MSKPNCNRGSEKETRSRDNQSYSKVATRAAYFLVPAGLMVKLLSVGSNLVLGWFLTASDFGIYGMAVAASAVVLVFPNGGVQQVLIRHGAARYNELVGPSLWISIVINITFACILAGLAPVIAAAYTEPELRVLLYISCIILVASSLKAVLFARLQIDLRYGWQAAIGVWGALVQYSCTIVLAILGFGALSFFVSLLVVTISEGLVLLVLAGRTLRFTDINFAIWPRILGEVKWLFPVTLAGAISLQSDRLVAGLSLEPSVLGAYVFAVMFVTSTQQLVTGHVRSILFPILSRMKEEPARQKSAVSRALAMLLVISSPVLGMLGLCFPYLEMLLYSGKWVESVAAVQLLAVAFPLRSLLSVISSWNLSVGYYRVQVIVLAANGFLVALAAGIGALVGGTAVSVAVGVALANGIFCPGFVIFFMRLKGWVWADAMRCFSSYVVALILAIVAYWIEVSWLLVPSRSEISAASFVSAGGLLLGYVFCYLAVVRIFLESQLAEALRILPSSVRGVASRMLLVKL